MIVGKVQRQLAYRWKSVKPSLVASWDWRGQRPRVYLHNIHPHPIFKTYASHPPLRYAPYPIAELCHWVDMVPGAPLLKKAHVLEIEHPLVLTPKNRPRPMRDWFLIESEREVINGVVARDECRKVVTFSPGLVEHSKRFIDPQYWSKLDYVYPAFPSQPEYERATNQPFNILVIASRFSDKGVPEALDAYARLRQRFGRDVKLTLISQDVPPDYALPEGVEVHGSFRSDAPFMTPEFKAQMYQTADVLLLPCFSETAACFTEATAFGVPIVTTRIHHGDAFVEHGVTGFLVDAPLFTYSDDYATRWNTAEDFMKDLENRRAQGDFTPIVDQTEAYIASMIEGGTATMRTAARALHAERFSPEVRNERLLKVYGEALARG